MSAVEGDPARLLARAQDPRGERGQLGPLEGILLLGTMLALAAGFGAAVNYATNELSGPGKPPPITPKALATFDAPPDNDCGKRVLGQFSGTVHFEGGVWTAPDTPTPKLPFQPDEAEIKKYNAEVTFWNDLMKDRVGAVQKELKEQDCAKAKEPITNPKTNPPGGAEAALPVGGTYELTEEGQFGGGDCSKMAGIASTLVVSVGQPNPEKGLMYKGGTIVLSGSHGSITWNDIGITSAGGFSRSNITQGAPADPFGGADDHLAFDASFVSAASTVRVSGSVSSLFLQCGISFTGLKR